MKQKTVAPNHIRRSPKSDFYVAGRHKSSISTHYSSFNIFAHLLFTPGVQECRESRGLGECSHHDFHIQTYTAWKINRIRTHGVKMCCFPENEMKMQFVVKNVKPLCLQMGKHSACILLDHFDVNKRNKAAWGLCMMKQDFL